MSQVPIEDVKVLLEARGFTGVSTLPAPAPHQRFTNQNTVIVCPTRVTPFCAQCGGEVGRGVARFAKAPTEVGKCVRCGADATGKIDFQVVDSWLHLESPMNSKRVGPMFAVGYEVGHAYDALVAGILATPEIRDYPYLLSLEDDGIVPWNLQLLLLDTIENGRSGDGRPFDAVSGLYHLKQDDVVSPEGDHRETMHRAHVYGDPDLYRKTGRLEFTPWDMEALKDERGAWKQRVVEVTGVAMGCTLWRMDLFRELPAPWFTEPRRRGIVKTQDLLWCKRLMEANKRLGVDLAAYCGHKDVSGEIF